MDEVTVGLEKISKDISENKKSFIRKMMLPAGLTAGLAAGIVGARLLFRKRPGWKQGQREAVIKKIEDMINAKIKKGSRTI